MNTNPDENVKKTTVFAAVALVTILVFLSIGYIYSNTFGPGIYILLVTAIVIFLIKIIQGRKIAQKETTLTKTFKIGLGIIMILAAIGESVIALLDGKMPRGLFPNLIVTFLMLGISQIYNGLYGKNAMKDEKLKKLYLGYGIITIALLLLDLGTGTTWTLGSSSEKIIFIMWGLLGAYCIYKSQENKRALQ